VVREDTGSGLVLAVSGAQNVARRSRSFSQLGLVAHPARVNGGVGFVSYLEGDLFTVAALTVRNNRITALDFILDPKRLADLDFTILD